MSHDTEKGCQQCGGGLEYCECPKPIIVRESGKNFSSDRRLTDKEEELLKTLWFETLNSLNHGCCDVDKTLFKDWTLEERQNLVKGYHEYNGDPEEYDPKYIHLGDCSIMRYLSSRLFTK